MNVTYLRLVPIVLQFCINTNYQLFTKEGKSDHEFKKKIEKNFYCIQKVLKIEIINKHLLQKDG